MPRRNKKSTAKTGISINIKNVMKQQVQQLRTRRYSRSPPDVIRLGRNPQHNLETGSMTRLQNPALTYASRPLSQFPSLASLAPIEFAPPLSQLKSQSIPVTTNSAPIVTPEQDKQNDRIEQYRPSVKEIPSTPIIPEYNTKYGEWNDPQQFNATPPVERYLVPAGISSRLLDVVDGKEDPVIDESQRIVAGQLPYVGARDRVRAMMEVASGIRGRPRLEAGAVGKKKERLQYGPPIPHKYQQGRQPIAGPSAEYSV
jgi:hypothetical protein